MKKSMRFPLLLVAVFVFALTSCEEDGTLSETLVVEGLKEALTIGTDTSVAKASSPGGYFLHPVNKILLPEEADVVIDVVSAIPGGDLLIDETVLKMNEAAELAARQATPIFVDAITGMTIADGWDILQGSNRAATDYLEVNTRTQLHGLFKPEIESALSSVGAQQAWGEVMSLYNSIPFVADVDTDLSEHTTSRGLDGLFYNVAEEEGKIRTDVDHRVTDLLVDVFAEQD